MMNLDLKKYKRVFAFGCSFTNYYWPTWADIMAFEMPLAKYYNYGRCGAGNTYIANRIVEADMQLKFTEDDLIMVMWTSLCREDRYFHGNWCCPGNIFTQGVYDKNFVERFCDPKGYLIRDMAQIQLVSSHLKNSPADVLMLSCQPFDEQQERDHNDQLDPAVVKIMDAYSGMIKEIPPTLFELEMLGTWENGHEYMDPNHGRFPDYHPDPTRYYNYLKKLGIKFSKATQEYVEQSTRKLKATKTKEDIFKTFGNEPNAHHYSVSRICF